jgi:hypothetical protein
MTVQVRPIASLEKPRQHGIKEIHRLAAESSAADPETAVHRENAFGDRWREYSARRHAAEKAKLDRGAVVAAAGPVADYSGY